MPRRSRVLALRVKAVPLDGTTGKPAAAPDLHHGSARLRSLVSTRHEIHGDGIDAVTRIAWRKALSNEYVAKVPSAVGTNNFSPSAIRVWQPRNCPFYFVVKAWPSTMGLKLVVRTIKRSVTTLACIQARGFMQIVWTGMRRFRPLVDDNTFLFWCQRVHGNKDLVGGSTVYGARTSGSGWRKT